MGAVMKEHALNLVEHGSLAVERRTLNRESPVLSTRCCCFEVWAFSFFPRCPSPLSSINEYLAIDSGGNASKKSSCSNCSFRRSQVGFRMSRSARGCRVKRFELSDGLDTTLRPYYCTRCYSVVCMRFELKSPMFYRFNSFIF